MRKLGSGGEVEIRFSSNPSHLEAVDPVVEGQARARQRIRGDTEHRRKVLPLLVHGDAAFIAQGVVAETLNLSQLPGYSTGGTIHIVVNNQIGFTTLPKDARSSTYSTDIAKMIEAPIFHVNGDDPLAVKFVSDMAFDFRQRFGRDVVIDMYCYRRYGHNEGDEPSFTQPDLYAKIEKRPSVTQLYKHELLEAGTLSEDDAVSLETEFGLRLEMTRDEVDVIEKRKASEKARFRESTAIFQPEYSSESEPTAISEKTLRTIVDGLTRVPEGFEVQPKIKRIVLDHERKVFEEGGPYEWHYAEALAFGSLLLDGIPIDCRARIARGVLLAHGIRCCTTRRQANLTCRSCILLKNKPAFAFTIARFQKLPSSGSIMGTPSITRRCFVCGKRSSAISRTARRSSSISSSSPPSRNGSDRAGLCCYFRTATKARVRNIPAPALSVFCKLARGQHPGLQSDDRRAVFSCAASPDETRLH